MNIMDSFSKFETFCRDCENKNLQAILDLGKQPLANALCKDNNKEELKVPLILCRCEICGTIQLNQTVYPEILFKKYVWITGTSIGAKNFSETFANYLTKRMKSGSNFIVEIASNDGTFLRPFIQRGFNVLGVDPASNIATIASTSGVPTINDFFSKAVAEKIVGNYGRADCIFARNVIPHVANAKDVINGIHYCLKDDGLGAIEFHRADIILNELHYDSIYHEHLYYHSLLSMMRLLSSFGLHPFDIENSPISGGSYILYFSKIKKSETSLFKNAINNEKTMGISDLQVWINFSNRVKEHKSKLQCIIRDLKKQNKKIIAWGASARSSTLLNYCNFSNSEIDAVIDKSDLKHGFLTPGSNIPIIHPDKLRDFTPDVIIILAWNFYDEIIDELRNKYNWKGTVIKPLPKEPELIQIL